MHKPATVDTRARPVRWVALALLAALLAGCGTSEAPNQAFQATQPTLIAAAPVYTVTPTRTPIPSATVTPTASATATETPIPSATPTLTASAAPTDTPIPFASATPTLTASAAPTDTPIPFASATPTLTASAAPTEAPPTDAAASGPSAVPSAVLFTPAPILTLTPPLPLGAPAAIALAPAAESTPDGWSCGDFPCEDDTAAWLERLRVPEGFSVELAGRFPGQVQQIAFGPDDRLYATVLQDGTRYGAVYAMAADGSAVAYSGRLASPIGLAFQPWSGVLYVSARETLEGPGGVWRVPPGGGEPAALITGLPCCLSLIDNQPNGLAFGRDGFLYVGVGATTDTSANPPRTLPPFRELVANEAAVLRINPATGESAVFSAGLRNPFDLALDSLGRLYATDEGLLDGGLGDRVLRLAEGAHFGFPYWMARGCTACPVKPAAVTVSPDLLALPPGTTPRGLAVYTGAAFPSNLFDTLFVALWNTSPGGQRIIQIDPRRAGEAEYVPTAFMTGLIRPIDLAIAPDGALLVADYVYGHVWRVRYTPAA